MSGRYDRSFTPEQIAAVKDEGIDFSDIPELDEGFWERAELVEPDLTDQITDAPEALRAGVLQGTGQGLPDADEPRAGKLCPEPEGRIRRRLEGRGRLTRVSRSAPSPR